ncbi:MAG: 3-oxoacyl-ACP synthase, partial [Nitrospinaceae bacterium]|nr:3-oxoacyl-ACP synthase [Nitrospinaceae bacterium]
AVKRMTEVIQEALGFNGLSIEEIGLLIPHQANERIIRAVAERLKYPMEKVLMNIHKYGNTSAASIPIGINEARRNSRIQLGETSVLGAVGAGLTWGAAVIKW